MKKNISILIIFVGAIGLIWSCTKKLDLVAPTSGTGGYAFLKVAQFSPNFRGVVNNRDSFNVYVNNVKVNGGFLTYGSYFPSTTNLYAAVPSGAVSLRLTVNGVLTPDSVTLLTVTKTLDAGSYYSLIITDSILTTNESQQMFLKDNFVLSDTLHFTLRFVHAILNDTAGKNVDIYSFRQASNLFSNIKPGTVTAFTSFPYTLLSDTLSVRRAGTLSELYRLNTVTFARQRAYTLIYKGLPGATTGTKPRSLTVYADQ